MKRLLLTFITLSSIALFTSCNQRSVTRISPDQTVDLSGRWNDTDSKLVAEEMIKDALSRPWLENYRSSHDKKPVIIVGMVSNKSHEHIPTETFIKDIEKEFINSGMIRVVQNSVFREKVREERADQQEFASPETAKKWGRELGADYMMFGTVNSIIDSYRDKKTIFYKVNLELTDMETNEIVWIGDKEIKKFIEN